MAAQATLPDDGGLPVPAHADAEPAQVDGDLLAPRQRVPQHRHGELQPLGVVVRAHGDALWTAETSARSVRLRWASVQALLEKGALALHCSRLGRKDGAICF